MTNIRDYVHTLTGRYVWHGDNDLELQCAQWGFGEAGTVLIVAPGDKMLRFRTVECGAAGRWLTDAEETKLGPGMKTTISGPNYPNNLRIFEAEVHDYKSVDEGGTGEPVEGTTYIPVWDDLSTWATGVAKEREWIIWLVAAIIIIIILVGLYVTAAKATRGTA